MYKCNAGHILTSLAAKMEPSRGQRTGSRRSKDVPLAGKGNPMNAMPQFPLIQVGDPLHHENLTIFPIYSSGPTPDEVEYLLSDEAVSAGCVTVEEINESGSVPTLLVTNRGDQRVLFLEGEELRGAKQNRVLNTSVLIGARTKTTIPVSCVEQGRWRFRSHQFTPSHNYSSPKLRQHLKQSVSLSLRQAKATDPIRGPSGPRWTGRCCP